MTTANTPDIALLLPRLILDAGAIFVLLFVLFYRNHKRPDLVAVYLACNVGLFSILITLSFSPLSSGVGFALFGVLSIIRLRSFEYTHSQIAYFFMSLSLALICSIDLASIKLPALLALMMLLAMAIVDNRAFLAMSTHAVIVIDRVIIDPLELTSHLENVLNAKVIRVNVTTVNFLQETVTVDVTYRRN